MDSGRLKPIDAFRRRTARRLRANTTDAEVRLWRALRRLSLSGSHFRRQVPVGPFVADFACLAARLIIEIDGSQHAAPDGVARDMTRTQWLAAEGYTVLRFWNNEINGNIEGVLTAIYAALYGSMDAEPQILRHERSRRPNGVAKVDHPTPPRQASLTRRPSPSRGG